MTDLTPRVALETRQHRAFTNVTVNDGNLPLNPNDTAPAKVVVYVSAVPSSKGAVAGFASSPDPSTVYTGGLQWSPSFANSKHAVLVIFMFVTDTTPHPTSVTYTGNGLYYTNTYTVQTATEQAMCIPYSDATYSFTVNFSDNTTHDPQIVVTPL